ncbi:thioesterase [Vandammella animalimorsus]|uniref:Thioesterase n=1 Tax=Vandammella animalimorsus TaxID=2029117 RepID=A0A2A2AJL1_9BURK|nr:thioesterase family protein [Vandammella animalimorsus]PAT37933.1 thioesterase [Vandammella animalimorsus]
MHTANPSSPASAARPEPLPRSAFAAFERIDTRWSDNDIYGHVNNVVYYSWFDTAVNRYLIAQGVLDIHAGSVIGLVIETQCNYFAPLAFPQAIEVGLRTAHLGRSSVRYELGIFAQGQALCAARGHFVHVYVDRDSRRPVPLPEPLRQALQRLQMPSDESAHKAGAER